MNKEVMLISLPCPCHNCTERALGCHADCRKYKWFKIATKAYRAQILQKQSGSYYALRTQLGDSSMVSTRGRKIKQQQNRRGR